MRDFDFEAPQSLQQAIELLAQSTIDEVAVTDTIPLNSKAQELDSIKVLSVAAMLGEGIKRIDRNESVSSLCNNI